MIGGIFADLDAWRWVFWLFAVQGVGVAWAAFVMLPRGDQGDASARVAWPQLALIAAGVGAIGLADIAHDFVRSSLLIALGVLLLLAMVWMVWIAPIMLAELALDVALSAGLYRTMKRVDADNWLHITLRHTLRPFAAAFVCAALVGGVMQWIAPQATTLGEVFSERTASGE